VQPSDHDSCNDDVVLADPLSSSRVNGSTSEVDFQSLLLTKDVVERYFLAEKKLRLDLKNICQDDHTWKLKTLDMNDIGVVKAIVTATMEYQAMRLAKNDLDWEQH
jgi:hypothetical protein